MRDLFITAIIFGLLPFVFKRPWLGILLWSWLGYMNPHRLAWGFAYSLPFSMIVGLVTIVAFMASKEKKVMPWTRETIVLLVFVGWMLITTFFAFYPDLAWVQWDKVWKIQLMVFLTALIITDRQKLHWLVWVIALSFGFYGVKGGIFTIINGGAYRVQGPTGTFIAGNNELALALVMTIPLIRYLHLQETRHLFKMGLASAMVLTGVAAIGSQSRGGLVAMLAMGMFLWLKSRNKIITGLYMGIAVLIMASVMPQSWYDRMNTINTYEQDQSTQGRFNAWHTAFNLAKDRITGGGFETFQGPTFRQYAPDPWNVRDVHSIYFEQIGEHGFIGFALFMLLGLLAWIRAQQIIKRCKNDPERKWAADLAAMIQVSLIGYAAGGTFLGMSYFDLPYHLMIILVLAAKFTGLLEKQVVPLARFGNVPEAVPRPFNR
ncbi:MAG: putative O-glycosylation ligase, exosortase A system-associated [Thiobacillus sp.]|nr:putative O-glycosylation ligase, exosortase A system-associated [Thiobacillus sp.]MDP1924760.1 putative O-glycosylation ligase, exosortase A system-associated [Thiobacillus sp.]MDP3124884.1 putative O-glycosylation ligase, exosortase A system-associated [Thiobacillus sp.]